MAAIPENVSPEQNDGSLEEVRRELADRGISPAQFVRNLQEGARRAEKEAAERKVANEARALRRSASKGVYVPRSAIYPGAGFCVYHRPFLDYLRSRDLEPGSLAVMVEIARRFNGENNGKIFYPVSRIAKDFNIGKDRASRIVNALIKEGILTVKANRMYDGEKWFGRLFRVNIMPRGKGKSGNGPQKALLNKLTNYTNPKNSIFKQFRRGQLEESTPDYANCVERERRAQKGGLIKLPLSLLTSKEYRSLNIRQKELLLRMIFWEYDPNTRANIMCSGTDAQRLLGGHVHRVTACEDLKALEQAGFLSNESHYRGRNAARIKSEWRITVFDDASQGAEKPPTRRASSRLVPLNELTKDKNVALGALEKIPPKQPRQPG